jgi:putative transposase
MARQARQAISHIPYHIISRGNNRQTIFFSDGDYHFFLEAIGRAKKKYPCKVYSFVLMTNHVHLLVESLNTGDHLALFMKQVTQRYGQYVNKRYKRSGSLWEGRFKSSPVSTDQYLLACSRYIEMNPIRAGLAQHPEDYRYSSYGAKTGLRGINWLDYDVMYLALGLTQTEREAAYRTWMKESIPDDEWRAFREAAQRDWPCGNDRFKMEMESVLGRKCEIKKAGRKRKNVNPSPINHRLETVD